MVKSQLCFGDLARSQRVLEIEIRRPTTNRPGTSPYQVEVVARHGGQVPEVLDRCLARGGAGAGAAAAAAADPSPTLEPCR